MFDQICSNVGPKERFARSHVLLHIKKKYFQHFHVFSYMVFVNFSYIRWDDDVVFKNCAKGDDGKKKVRHYFCQLFQ